MRDIEKRKQRVRVPKRDLGEYEFCEMPPAAHRGRHEKRIGFWVRLRSGVWGAPRPGGGGADGPERGEECARWWYFGGVWGGGGQREWRGKVGLVCNHTNPLLQKRSCVV